MNSLFGSRKLIVGLLILASALVVVAIKGDVPAGLVNVMSVIFGGFVVGNAVEHVQKGMTDRTPESESPNPLQTPSEMNSKLDEVNSSVMTVQQTLLEIIKRIWPEAK